MWLQGQSLFSVNHSDRSRYTLLTLRSTFSHSGFIVFAQRNQMIWMRSLDWSERTAGTGWIQRKDRAFLLLCWDILAQLLTRHSVQLNYWKRTCVEISCCFKLVCVIFFPHLMSPTSHPSQEAKASSWLTALGLSSSSFFLRFTDQYLGVTFSQLWILRFCLCSLTWRSGCLTCFLNNWDYTRTFSHKRDAELCLQLLLDLYFC